jgi:hypothetical protein
MQYLAKICTFMPTREATCTSTRTSTLVPATRTGVQVREQVGLVTQHLYRTR